MTSDFYYLTTHANYPRIGPSSCERLGIRPISKIKAYKFLKKNDLRFWQDNSIKVSALSSYADADNWQIQSKGGVFDEAELFVEIGEVHVVNDMDPREQRKVNNLRYLDVLLSGSYDTRLQSVKMKRKNRFVYCLSHSISKDMFLKWHSMEGYDCVLQIDDVLAFTHAIQNADKSSKNLLSNGAFGTIDWVNYIPIPIDNDTLNKVNFESFGWWKDLETFQWQNEVRISWPLPDSDRNQSILTNSPYSLYVPDLWDHIKIFDIPSDWLNAISYGKLP